MIIKDAKGITAEVHLYDDITGLDFVEEYLHAGGLDRDADGTYLVKDARYIDDYATEACNGSNPDFEEPLNARWEYKELVTMKKRNLTPWTSIRSAIPYRPTFGPLCTAQRKGPCPYGPVKCSQCPVCTVKRSSTICLYLLMPPRSANWYLS